MWATSVIMSIHLRSALLHPAHMLPESVAQMLPELVAHFTGIRTKEQSKPLPFRIRAYNFS